MNEILITKEMLLCAMPDHPNALMLWLQTWERLVSLVEQEARMKDKNG